MKLISEALHRNPQKAEPLPRGANGVLVLPKLWWGLVPAMTITGGPFRNRPPVFGVCLLETTRGVSAPDVHLPINDFSVPADDTAAADAVFKTLMAGSTGPVYVGCMGGWGRTGLFLSLLAKAAGVSEPVAYVRANYTPKAVETDEQAAYVARFDVAPLRRRLFWARIRTCFGLS